jgi:hypothetical protein
MGCDLCAPKKRYTAKSYIQILREGLLPILKIDSIFQRDGTGFHRTGYPMKFIKEKGFRWIQDWPLYSPYPNPVEHYRPLLKEHMCRPYQNV